MTEYATEPRNVTDWFIHEIRNALGPFNAKGLEELSIQWDQSDYEKGKEVVGNFLQHLDEGVSQGWRQGGISEEQMREFASEALEKDWDSNTTKSLYLKFKKLIEAVA